MPNQADDFDHTVQLCIEACQAVLKYGTPEMCVLAQVLLATIGRELAKRVAEDDTEDEA